MNFNLVIGGEAGQGLKTVQNILKKSFFRLGFNLHTSKDYMSRIRGGHNFMNLRIGDEPISAPTTAEDILVALNKETIDIHAQRVTKEGVILHDGEVETDPQLISLPAGEIAKEAGNKKTANTVFMGAVFKLLGLDLQVIRQVLGEYFANKKEVKEVNITALEQGYQQVETKFSLPEVEQSADQLLLNGNQAVGLGAAVADVDFYSAYPMTPATGIMNYLAGKENELEIAVEQAEDELAAINMALGASYSGLRAMTGTSGGGFSLMNEGFSLAGITELPLVIAEVQRPGPATGLPTRTGQGDLSFIINSGQGEFPKVVLAPRNVEDAFYQTFRAFNLAENYQLPVVIVSDQFLADSSQNVPEFNLEELEIKNGYLSATEVANRTDYQRYQITESGISPLAYPGQIEGATVMVDSDEHDEEGYIIEDAATRKQMVEKRQRKVDKLIREELQEPKYAGPEKIDYLLVSWGSTYGPLLEARNKLASEAEIGLLSFSDVWPLPTERLADLLQQNPKLVVVEGNSEGQFAQLIRQETGQEADYNLLKYDGRPFHGPELYHRLQKEVIQ